MNRIKIFLLTVLSFLTLNSYAQTCPIGDLIITSQDQVDNFIITYPMCDLIDGNLKILSTDVNNLNGLSNLTSILGNLSIAGNHQLTNLSGLESINTISGDIWIKSNNTLDNLSGLEGITKINGELTINSNPLLTSVAGLQNVDTIGTIDFYFNPELESLAGLSSLNYVEDYARFFFSHSLVNFNGLENLTEINGHFYVYHNAILESFEGLENLHKIGSYLYIKSNSNLISFSGLNNLDTIGWYLYLTDNDLISSLYGLNNLNSIDGFLNITSNDGLNNLSGLDNLNVNGISELNISYNNNLSACSYDIVCDYLSLNGSSTIEANAPGCDNVNVVTAQCIYPSRVNHPVFYDLNEDGVLDSGEPYYPPGNLSIEPNNVQVYSNDIDGGTTYLPWGDYIFSFDAISNPYWEVTTGPASYNLQLDAANPEDTIYFGIRPLNVFADASSVIAAPDLRCNNWNNLDVIAENKGTSTLNGTLWFTWDEIVEDLTYNVMPDTFVLPNTVGWFFEDLYPGNTFKQGVNLLVPGPPDFPIGTDLINTSKVNYEDANGTYESNVFARPQTISCSYDPNDKQVSPVYSDNYNLMGEDLIYTVRFQNTGNAEAFDVLIRDTLDANLDPNTFNVISSSHSEVLSTTLADNQFLSFEFTDINLPDSTTNFDESQGYIMYRIRSLAGIPEGTEIYNSASIYFDNNPPIQTNTTESIMLSTFDYDADGVDFFSDCDDENPDVNPDATEITYNGVDDDCNELTLDDDLDQDGFNLADDCDDENPDVNPDATEIAYNGVDDDCNELTLDDDLDQDGFNLEDDCDDENPDVNSDATEIAYNGIDDDCNELTLDDDLDQDGFNLADDCDDENPDVNPDATEIAYNGIDDDCNELTPDDDLDQDGYNLADDCDDENPDVNPDAIEIAYNGVDDDCNELTLDDDLDQDGYNLANDCDDENPDVNPDATEIAYNGVDDDCNELTLDDDLDQDGYNLADDCDDENPDVNPDATEIANNGIDENCDGEDLIVANTEQYLQPFKVFPNPIKSWLKIKFSEEHSIVQVNLRNIYSQIVFQKVIQNNDQINLSHLENGVYLLTIHTDGISWVEKIVKVDK